MQSCPCCARCCPQNARCLVVQATEPAALVALLQGCEAAVLVGDPRQLPPTVVSTQAGPLVVLTGKGTRLGAQMPTCLVTA